MMGIYIPGMDMPKRGHTITITIVGSGQAYVEYFDCRPHVEETIEYTAVPVPPHGRMIDADRLEVIAYSGTEGRPDTFDAGVEWLAEQIDALPTVIPKEEEA